MRHRLYRDVVHGQIRLLRGEDNSQASETVLGRIVPLIRDTNVFQRLRSIRQNGLTNFVFPGMEHSRFAHSMGVFFLARRMYDSLIRNSGLKKDSRERSLVSISGLVHDIGHGPFSHSLEQAFTDFDHEQMTKRLLLEHPEVRAILDTVDSKFAEDLAPYIDKESRTLDKWSYRIISSQLDADRLDYMLRDSVNAGLRGHGFDLERILDVISIEDDRLTFEESSMPTLEAYLMSRLHLHEIVYFHKTVRAAQCLLVAIFRRVADLVRIGVFNHLETVQPVLKQLLSDPNMTADSVDLKTFSRVGDHQFWAAFDEWAHSATDPILRDLCIRLVCRRPFKALTLHPSTSEAVSQQTGKAIDACAKQLNISTEESNRYYCHVDNPKTVAYKVFDPDSERADEEIWMRFRSGQVRKLSDFKDNPIVQATSKPRVASFFVYPVECHEKISEIIPHKEYEP